MRLLRERIEQMESMQKGTDIDVQFERLSEYNMRNLVDFDKYTALSMAEFLSEGCKAAYLSQGLLPLLGFSDDAWLPG